MVAEATTGNALVGVWSHSATTDTIVYTRNSVLYTRLITDTGSSLTVGSETTLIESVRNSGFDIRVVSGNRALLFFKSNSGSALIGIIPLSHSSGVVSIAGAVQPMPDLVGKYFPGGTVFDAFRAETASGVWGMVFENDNTASPLRILSAAYLGVI